MKDFYRKVYKFSTPAGTPSISGAGDTRLGNVLPLPDIAQHWGILVHCPDSNTTARDTFFELYRPGGGIGVLKRSRDVRDQEERGNSRFIQYTDTGCITDLDDEEIEACAQNICKVELRNNYDLVDGNCQSMVNLLIQRIAHGDKAVLPLKTSSHSFFGSGPASHNFRGTDFDRGKPVNLPHSQPPRPRSPPLGKDWTFAKAMASPYYLPHDNKQTINPGREMDSDGLINIDITPRPPSSVTELREKSLSEARFTYIGGGGHPINPDRAKAKEEFDQQIFIAKFDHEMATNPAWADRAKSPDAGPGWPRVGTRRFE